MNAKRIIQWAVYVAIAAWALVSFCVIAGDENPDAPMSLNRFCIIKLMAAASLYACYRVGKICCRRGLLPPFGIR